MKRLVRRAFRRFTAAAAKTAADKRNVTALLQRATSKSEKQKGVLAEVWDELTAFFRLLRSWVTGRYKEVPWRTIVLIVGAIAYFVSPIDVIPDWIPLAGFIDDLYVLRLVVRATRTDVQRYRAWESANAA
jgi:uncharacterized membrane protein YkvA (DUF1232 family)